MCEHKQRMLPVPLEAVLAAEDKMVITPSPQDRIMHAVRVLDVAAFSMHQLLGDWYSFPLEAVGYTNNQQHRYMLNFSHRAKTDLWALVAVKLGQ